MISEVLNDTTIDTIELTILQNRLSGELLVPSAPGFDKARRIVNWHFDRQPALIVRCRTTQDVAYAVAFAREHELEIAVRSGGHSVAGHSAIDGGMMIDLSQMRDIEIDPANRTAHVQPGATNGELVLATQEYGLITTTGTCATVGMGGSTLGGGIGWLMGRFGATVDNVLAFELVTADGTIRAASANENPDLFWALRGGGGNFGIVTAITYQLHPLGQVLGGVLVFPEAVAPQVLRLFCQVTGNAPDELSAHAILAVVPDFGPALVIQACYSGENLAEGERLLAPLRTLGPAIDLIAPRSYPELYMMLTPPIPPSVTYHDAGYTLRQPSEQALDTIIACAAKRPSPFSIIEFHHVHGAATRVASDATAFALREPHYPVMNISMWMEGDGEAETAWTENSRAQMAPFASSGLYVNFIGDEGQAKVREAYRANYERLAEIKRRYDPENVFHRNQNIRPA